MLHKVLLVLAAASLTALVLRLLSEREEQGAVERELLSDMDALREHLFRR